jgi:hypothetical protein
MIKAQQFGQSASIDLVALIALAHDLFFRGSHTTNFVTCGFIKSYNQAAQVPSSNVTCKSPRSPSINCRIMLAFVSVTLSIATLPTAFLTAIEILSLCVGYS